MQEKDPEFYKYLKGNDEKLLEFDTSDEDEGDDDDDDDNREHNHGSSPNDSDDQEEAMDNDVANEPQDVESQQFTGKIVTTEMVKKWREMLIVSCSYAILILKLPYRSY